MLEFPQPFGGVDEVPPLQRWAPVAGLVIALLAVAYGMIPFRQAGVVRCNAPLLGAEPLGDDLEKVG
ncbi:MAG: hypothetical protein ACRD0D_04825, partial [Acidimicrobiales bacterium]